ncbi:MAG TPA: hypothetical protein VMZ53_02905 [Kofleriaceae bacterium]|nr:hypothetical protein [Kofleriaceae bacterium]
MRRLLPASFLLFAACNFPHGSLGTGDGGSTGDDDASDAAIDAMIDAPDPSCYGRGAFYVCFMPAPTGDVTLQGNIDTTACTAETTGSTLVGATKMVSGVSVCVIAAASFTMQGATVGTLGDKPLLLLATGNITIPTGVELDGRSAAFPLVGSPGDGPNANPSDCGNRPSGASSTTGGGGGAGGTFGTKGGNGGNGGGAMGGMAAAVPTPFVKLRGGCPGGNGGGGNGSTGGAGGSGGGAIALFSHGTIQIDGTITVSGAGGEGGNASKGGAGGGGSGGMVVLDGAAVMMGVAGKIIANGGGGGAGAGNSTSGDDGKDAIVLDAAAPGGVLSASGATPGGAGAFGSTAAGSPQPGANGGGGGGGGAGVIRVLSGQALPSTKVSPPPTP